MSNVYFLETIQTWWGLSLLGVTAILQIQKWKRGKGFKRSTLLLSLDCFLQHSSLNNDRCTMQGWECRHAHDVNVNKLYSIAPGGTLGQGLRTREADFPRVRFSPFASPVLLILPLKAPATQVIETLATLEYSTLDWRVVLHIFLTILSSNYGMVKSPIIGIYHHEKYLFLAKWNDRLDWPSLHVHM